MPVTNTPLLQTHQLTKRYGNVTVLRDVTIDVQAGEIHALLGANGAGKSTLCKIISRLTSPSAGSMIFSGKDYNPRTKQEAESCGVEMVQQELNLIGTLSVAENLFLTRLPSRLGVLQTRKLHEQARDVLDRFGLAGLPTHTPIETLGIGKQQMVEIAAALARECKLLILDEPTAALSSSESESLFKHLNDLRSRGVGIIYISHRLDEIKTLADRATILRDGDFVATRSVADLSTDDMVTLMSGDESVGNRSAFSSFCRNEIAMQVKNISSGIVRNVSFKVRRGERFGITGLVGSGRTELLRAIFGADVASAGHVFIGADKTGHRFHHPREAVRAGLTMVTEDRKENGLLLSQSITNNATISSLSQSYSKLGWLKMGEEKMSSELQVSNLDVRCESIEQPVGTLSGGNQQKIAISKWLLRDGEAFLFDEPTRGIDVAARRRIYQLIELLVAKGKACVIVSSDQEELMEICDRIAVMCNGRLVDTFERGYWSHEILTEASFAEYVS